MLSTTTYIIIHTYNIHSHVCIYQYMCLPGIIIVNVCMHACMYGALTDTSTAVTRRMLTNGIFSRFEFPSRFEGLMKMSSLRVKPT